MTAAIRTRLAAIQHCYESELASNPSLAGRVLLRFVVQIDGRVAHGEVTDDTLGSPPMNQCMIGVIEGMRVDPAPLLESARFAYPFVFAPQP